MCGTNFRFTPSPPCFHNTIFKIDWTSISRHHCSQFFMINICYFLGSVILVYVYPLPDLVKLYVLKPPPSSPHPLPPHPHIITHFVDGPEYITWNENNVLIRYCTWYIFCMPFNCAVCCFNIFVPRSRILKISEFHKFQLFKKMGQNKSADQNCTF